MERIERVLITGGAGFIGTRLTRRLLDAGVQVRILDVLHPQVHGPDPQLPAWMRDECEILKADILDTTAVEGAVRHVDAVVHLAAETGTGQSMYTLRRYTDVNVGGTATLLEAVVPVLGRVRKLVVASSRAVYGEGKYACEACGDVYPAGRSALALAAARWEPPCPRCGGRIVSVPTDEDSQPRPVSVYGATKLCQEQLATTFGCGFGIPVVILRYQNVYGGGQSLSNPYTGILTHFFSALSQGEPPRVFEDGLESRDFVHVDDVVTATMLALELQGSGLFNVGSGFRTTILQLAEAMCGLVNPNVAPVIVGEYRLGDIRHCTADLRRAGSGLGYAPAVDFDEGLREFAEWAASQPRHGSGAADANRELAELGLLRTTHGE